MRVTKFTRRALAFRRQERQLLAAGFIYLHGTYLPINNGGQVNKVIAEVVIAEGGKDLYIRLADRDDAGK